ncbi:unnamed protein product [Albugo candida]|uniref:Uncharacterized protein n=1 Tax=Albugo candida TaxID=65357 RepID=A0A024GTA2_9STRA|nr:unnamed protein product [Albugo candida]|eukprot:CCI50188.1 unnamed protein product [Albugo candida]
MMMYSNLVSIIKVSSRLIDTTCSNECNIWRQAPFILSDRLITVTCFMRWKRIYGCTDNHTISRMSRVLIDFHQKDRQSHLDLLTRRCRTLCFPSLSKCIGGTELAVAPFGKNQLNSKVPTKSICESTCQRLVDVSNIQRRFKTHPKIFDRPEGTNLCKTNKYVLHPTQSPLFSQFVLYSKN